MNKSTKQNEKRINIGFPAIVHEQIRFAAGALGIDIQDYAVEAVNRRLATDKKAIVERAKNFSPAIHSVSNCTASK